MCSLRTGSAEPTEQWQRQAWVSLPLRSFDFVRKTLLNLLPALAGGAYILKDWSPEAKVSALLLILSLMAFFALLQYLRFQFRILSDRIEVRSGVFVRKSTSLHFERMQSVQTRQNLINRMLGLISVNIESAGSTTEEIQFYAVPQALGAHLKHALQRYRKSQSKVLSTPQDPALDKEAEPPQTLMSLGPSELFLVALCGNPLVWWASITTLLAFGFQDEKRLKWFVDSLLSESVMAQVMDSSFALGFLILGGLLLAFVLSTLGSVFWHLMVYFQYQLTLEGQELSNHAGLFTQKTTQMPLKKIQKISLLSHPLRRLFGFYQASLHQAGGTLSDTPHFVIPYWPQSRVPELIHLGMQSATPHTFSQVSPRYLSLLRRWRVFMPALIWGSVAYFWQPWLVLPGLVYSGFQWFLTQQSYRALKYAMNDSLIWVQKGWLAQKSVILAPHLVQKVVLSQSPYQRRHDLLTLVLWSATGSLALPCLPASEAQALADRVLYQVETSQRAWL